MWRELLLHRPVSFDQTTLSLKTHISLLPLFLFLFTLFSDATNFTLFQGKERLIIHSNSIANQTEPNQSLFRSFRQFASIITSHFSLNSKGEKFLSTPLCIHCRVFNFTLQHTPPDLFYSVHTEGTHFSLGNTRVAFELWTLRGKDLRVTLYSIVTGKQSLEQRVAIISGNCVICDIERLYIEVISVSALGENYSLLKRLPLGQVGDTRSQFSVQPKLAPTRQHGEAMVSTAKIQGESVPSRGSAFTFSTTIRRSSGHPSWTLVIQR